MASTTDNDYILPHGGGEVRRLNDLQNLMVKCNGYLLHPRITHRLSPTGGNRIADVATATGAFLRSLDAHFGPGTHTYTAFDMSAGSFPADHAPNFSYHLLDLREPCPDQWCGQFDVVHIRLVVGGFGHDDWAKGVQCAMAMLRPGGALMWTELRVKDVVPVLRGSADVDTVGTGKHLERFVGKALEILGKRVDAGVETLERVMREAGMQDVSVDVVSSDRLPALREEATLAMIDGAEPAARKQLELNDPGAWSLDDIENLRAQAVADMKLGWYTRFNVHNFIGFKP